SSVNDWRRLLLEYPEELQYCSQGLIKYNEGGNYIRLLGSSQINHNHRELRTSILFNQYLRKFFALDDNDYKHQRSDVGCYIEMKHNEALLRIRFGYKTHVFEVF